jgi:hypothetical protein
MMTIRVRSRRASSAHQVYFPALQVPPAAMELALQGGSALLALRMPRAASSVHLVSTTMIVTQGLLAFCVCLDVLSTLQGSLSATAALQGRYRLVAPHRAQQWKTRTLRQRALCSGLHAVSQPVAQKYCLKLALRQLLK